MDDVRLFTSACLEHTEATLAANSRKTNRAYKKIKKLYESIVAQDPSLLKPLLEHSNTGVQAWAGAALLPYFPKEAQKTLEIVAIEDSSITGFDAQMTLQEWRKNKKSFRI